MNVDFVARKNNHFFRNGLILGNYLSIEFAEKIVFDGCRTEKLSNSEFKIKN